MSTSSAYFGVKDANNYYSFIEPQWLTPHEVANEFRKFSRSSCGDDSLLIYPNELILAEDSNVIDVLLLAKYRHKNGNLKLKTVLLSQILNSSSSFYTSSSGASSSGSGGANSKLLILKLPKDSYYWSKVNDAHLIPKYALRAGYDHSTKQFSYVGRMKASSLLQSSLPPQQQQQQQQVQQQHESIHRRNAYASSPQQQQQQQQQVSTSPTHRSQYRLPQYYQHPAAQSSSSSSSSAANSLASTFKLRTVTNTITNLIGTLAHIYEYIPAMVLQLNDLSFLDDKKLIDFNDRATPALPPAQQSMHTYHNHQPGLQGAHVNQQQAAAAAAAHGGGGNGGNGHYYNYKHSNNDSLWYKLKAANKNRQNLNELEFNFISNNYEVLCLKRMPATLKQMCISKLLIMDEAGYEEASHVDQQSHYEASCSLPNSIKSLVWPSHLLPGHCLVKNSKLRSSNGLYEIYLNPQGALKLVKFAFDPDGAMMLLPRKTATFEKNIESLLVSHSGVFLVYDNNQPNRRPTMLYKHANRPAASSSSSSIFCSTRSNYSDDQATTTVSAQLKKILDTNSFSNLLLELSDSGFLRVIICNDLGRDCEDARSSKRAYTSVELIDLNEYFNGNRIMANVSSNSMTDSVSKSSSGVGDDQSLHSSTGSCNSTISASIIASTSASSSAAVAAGESSTVDLNTSLNNIKEDSIFIKLKLMTDLKQLRHLPGKIFSLVTNVFKFIANNIANRL